MFYYLFKLINDFIYLIIKDLIHPNQTYYLFIMYYLKYILFIYFNLFIFT